jgi:antitoxin component YwqK of YwqJK toxin-antitoxin module
MNLRVTILFLMSPIVGYTQIDTLDYCPYDLGPQDVNNHGGFYNKITNDIDSCTPCWLRYFNKDGLLLQEGLSYMDCALGKRIEYFPSGNIKAIRLFKTNETWNWTDFTCSVPHGTWIYYNEDGTIQKTMIYEDGVIKE